MNYRLIIKNRAVQDLRAQAEYLIRERDADRAIAFLAAAETTFAQLAKMPRLERYRVGSVQSWGK
ncbi:MAG: type II toxin-antitoxin system RelE/ParE family toxin [Oculatellaceae cyanobacterium Prado106]|jgi:plasmid stabilization system protein ParE|nr:type II toxin-antitoxin system RelE/ParE family toxin [Oculatellaceae cyanobacterium Prado106]